MQEFSINEQLTKKWEPILEMEGVAPIRDRYRRAAVAQLLENTEAEWRSMPMQYGMAGGLLHEDSPTNNFGSGAVQYRDPILIQMLRRSMPNLMAYDVCGVQPMSGPSGLIFAFRSLYTNQSGDEAFYNEVNTAFSNPHNLGTNVLGEKHTGGYPGNTTTGTMNLATNGIYNYGSTMNTVELESLGTTGNTAFPEMAFTIDKISVTPGGRALKAQYSIEMAHDLMKVHGLDAEKILSEMLTTEIIAEINREVIRTINVTAKRGAAEGTTQTGRFNLDVDSNGRWLGEKLQGLAFFLDLEANVIAKETRRGKGNIIICSSNVASALRRAGVYNYTPKLDNNGLNVDDTGNTFAGTIDGYRVYVDPYATGNYATIGFKGTSPMDAGLFYCPYVPLQKLQAIDPGSFQPAIGFKTRYAMAQNPFSKGVVNGAVGNMNATLTADTNVYYRRVLIDNILG